MMSSTRLFRPLRLIAPLTLLAGTLAAQQAVNETRDPNQRQDADFAKAVRRSGRASRTTAVRSSTTCRCVNGIPTPKDVLGYYIGAPRQAHLLRRHSEVLPRAGQGDAAREGRDAPGKSDEGRELVVVWVSSDENIKNLQHNRDNLAKIADPRGLYRSADPRADRDDQAALPSDGRAAQRRDGPVGDADGARLSPGDRDVAAHHADPQQRHRLGHAGRRAGRPRSQRRLVLRTLDFRRRRYATTDTPAAAGARAALGGGRRRVADSCPTGASTSSTTTIATSTSRRCRCARSPIGTSPRIRRSCTICTKRSR